MKTQDIKPSLKDLFTEIRTLRREVSLIMPSESLKEYKHPKRIVTSYKKALKEHPLHADYSNKWVRAFATKAIFQYATRMFHTNRPLTRRSTRYEIARQEIVGTWGDVFIQGHSLIPSTILFWPWRKYHPVWNRRSERCVWLVIGTYDWVVDALFELAATLRYSQWTQKGV